MLTSLPVSTGQRIEFVDITRKVSSVVESSGIQSGLCVVFVPHTTAAVTINENADPAVCSDILAHTADLVPQKRSFAHNEGNSDSHIKASMFGFSEHIIIEKGHLVLGTWQGIYFCEFDGPRNRKVHIKVING